MDTKNKYDSLVEKIGKEKVVEEIDKIFEDYFGKNEDNEDEVINFYGKIAIDEIYEKYLKS